MVEIEVTIGFVEQSYKVVEGEGGVTLEVEVSEGEIPVGHTVVVNLVTTDLSATGMRHLILSRMHYFCNCCMSIVHSTHTLSVSLFLQS